MVRCLNCGYYDRHLEHCALKRKKMDSSQCCTGYNARVCGTCSFCNAEQYCCRLSRKVKKDYVCPAYILNYRLMIEEVNDDYMDYHTVDWNNLEAYWSKDEKKKIV